MFWLWILIALIIGAAIGGSFSQKKEEDENLLDIWEIKEVKIPFKERLKSIYGDFKKAILD